MSQTLVLQEVGGPGGVRPDLVPEFTEVQRDLIAALLLASEQQASLLGLAEPGES